MTKQSQKYFVHYVEDSTPKMKAFKTKRAMQTFLRAFSEKIDQENGYWIDFAFRGKMLSYDLYYQESLEGK